VAVREDILLAGAAGFLVLRFFDDVAAADAGALGFAAPVEADSTGAFANEPIPGQSRHSSKADVRYKVFLSNMPSRSNHWLVRQPVHRHSKQPKPTL
jgi:hypothetical protein